MPNPLSMLKVAANLVELTPAIYNAEFNQILTKIQDTPTPNTIPYTTSAGKLQAGYGGAASTLATLDSDGNVVESPANRHPFNQYNGTGARIIATVYRNTSEWPMFVSVSAYASVDATLIAYTDGTASPSTVVANMKQAGIGAYTLQIFFIVLPSNYYKVEMGGSTLVNWTEWY